MLSLNTITYLTKLKSTEYSKKSSSASSYKINVRFLNVFVWLVLLADNVSNFKHLLKKKKRIC